MKLALSKLTKPELREITENANFTEDEMMVFQLLSNGYQICYIADTMSISSSSVKRIMNRISEKMERVGNMEEKTKKDKREVPIWHKAIMTMEEASKYSNIGICTIRKLVNNPRCTFVLMNGNRKLIKRKEFEEFLSKQVEL